MKKQTRRSVLGLLSMLPISSVAFASEFASSIGSQNKPNLKTFDYEGELMRRLDEGSLNEKYYDYMKRHNIPSLEALNSKSFAKYKSRLTKEFVSDLVNPQGGDDIVTAALSSIPPD